MFSNCMPQGSNGATSAPAACSTAPGRIDVVVRGPDFAYYYTWMDAEGSVWAPWESWGGVFTSKPSVTLIGSQMVVFGRGLDSAIYYGSKDTLNHFSGWNRIDADSLSPPSAGYSDTIPQMAVTWRSVRGLELATSTSGGWVVGDFPPEIALGDSDPCLLAVGTTLIVFCAAADGNSVWFAATDQTPATTVNWQQIAASVEGIPAVCVTGQTFVLAVRAADGTITFMTLTPSTPGSGTSVVPGTWISLGSETFGSDPTVVATRTGFAALVLDQSSAVRMQGHSFLGGVTTESGSGNAHPSFVLPSGNFRPIKLSKRGRPFK